jgi:hypothetical protein
MDLRATAIDQRKCSYDTGHGDFSFGRLLERDNGLFDLLQRSGEPNSRGNNMLFVELDGFDR